MSADEETEQQQSPNAEEDHPGNHSPVTGGSKPPTCKSTSFSFIGSAATAKERKQDTYRRVRELEKEIKRIKLEDDLDSDDSLFPKNKSRRKQKPLYEKFPIKPEKFPSKDYNRWENWVKHFNAVALANGWNDGKKIAAMPTCLTSWAIEEFETVPRKLLQKNLAVTPRGLPSSSKSLNRKCKNIAVKKLHGLILKVLNNGKMKT